MNCPFLINENKVITNNINRVGDIDKTIVTHERWYAPCMEEQCPFYDEITKMCRRIEWKR